MAMEKMTRPVQLASVRDWVDGWDAMETADMLLDLMNKAYTTEQLKQDFEEYLSIEDMDDEENTDD